MTAGGGMRLPASVAVIGLGIIGASLCRALRAHVPGVGLTGVDTDRGVVNRARADGLCDVAGTSPALLREAEVIVICSPLDAIPDWLSLCAEHAPAALVTDCGSTKAWIVERARGVGGGLRFLGGHPMAGRERGGYDRADADLFAGCTWVLTPESDDHLATFAPWLGVLSAFGAHVEVMSPEDHDRAAVWASHLPLAVSSALLLTAAAATEWPVAKWLTAGAFRDGTRLAAGDPRLHATIATTNATALGPAIDGLIEQLLVLRGSLADGERVREYFEVARRAREEWLDIRTREGRPVS